MAKMNQDAKIQTVFQDLATSALWGDRLLKIKVRLLFPIEKRLKACSDMTLQTAVFCLCVNE